MAVLPDNDRAETHQAYMSHISQKREGLAVLTKTMLRAAINAVDDWVDANAASFNTNLPVTARTNLTAKQKAELLVFVVRRRFEVT